MGITLTLILVIFTCIVSYQAMDNRSLKSKLLMHPASVHEFGQIYRFLTSGFVHANWMHLGINMYVLYMFGEMVETGMYVGESGKYGLVSYNIIFGETMGRINFLILYLGSIIAGSIPSFIKHKNNSYYSALGASGGTSGIVFAAIFFDPWAWMLFPPLPFVLLGVGYLWYSSYMAKKGGDNIGHDAHFWGAVFGFVYTAAIIGISKPEYFQQSINILLEGLRAFGS